MNLIQKLSELKEQVDPEIEVGASVQSIVELHFADIQKLLRSSRKSSGLFTVKQLAEYFDVGFYAFRSALERAKKKTKYTGQIAKKTNVESSFQKSNFLKESGKNLESNEAVIQISHINEEEIIEIYSGKEFLIDFEDGNGIYKMVLKSKLDEVLIFDGYPRSGLSKVSKQFKFNLSTKTFERG